MQEHGFYVRTLLRPIGASQSIDLNLEEEKARWKRYSDEPLTQP